MIDTITIRIHNAIQYKLYEYFNSPAVGITYINNADPDIKTDTSKISGVYFNDSDNFIEFRRVGRLYNPTSNYHLSVKCNPGDNIVDLEYSCPKWTYGHNVAQLIDYHQQDSQKCYQVLLRHLVAFFDRHIPFKIEPGDIEIRRIDMCYNQFHETYQDAMNYLDLLKPGFTRLARKNGSVPVPYDTGIHFTTRRMSFKCYHKGSEFRKNDYYKLLDKHIPGYDIEATARAADRILRYEATFRSSYLNYAFMQLYTKIKNPAPGIKNSIYRKMFYLARVEKKAASKAFCLKSEYDYLNSSMIMRDCYFEYESMFEPNRVSFDQNLFDYMFNHTWKLIKIVSVMPSGDEKLFLQAINRKNQEAERAVFSSRKRQKINPRSIMTWFRLSQKPGGLKQAMRKGMLSERQYYNILKLFKSLGYQDYNPKGSLMRPDFGYSEYKRIFGPLH